jgi:hypothetical protein
MTWPGRICPIPIEASPSRRRVYRAGERRSSDNGMRQKTTDFDIVLMDGWPQ